MVQPTEHRGRHGSTDPPPDVSSMTPASTPCGASYHEGWIRWSDSASPFALCVPGVAAAVRRRKEDSALPQRGALV